MLDPVTGTIVMKDVSNAYITSNFDGTGLGIGEEVGYAICNGNNGTRNWNGRVPVAYGTSYPTMGATAGASTHALSVAEMPLHGHTVKMSNATGINADTLTAQNGGSSGGSTFSNGTGSVPTGNSGSGTAHNNMQPYIVTLVTMKL